MWKWHWKLNLNQNWVDMTALSAKTGSQTWTHSTNEFLAWRSAPAKLPSSTRRPTLCRWARWLERVLRTLLTTCNSQTALVSSYSAELLANTYVQVSVVKPTSTTTLFSWTRLISTSSTTLTALWTTAKNSHSFLSFRWVYMNGNALDAKNKRGK